MRTLKTINIIARKNSDTNIYIDHLKLNGKEYKKNGIDHFEPLKGTKLKFDMSDKPNLKRGTEDSDVPFSISTYEK